MPIYDHFKGAISHARSWSAFHHLWAGLIAGELNRLLPEGFIAESTIYTGSIEVDVRVDEWMEQAKSLSTIYQVPPPSAAIHTNAFDVSEIQVYDLHHARKAVGVIEIVSPANKDRPQHREAFLSKCYNFVAYGISTVIVDIVTSRLFNFSDALVQKLRVDAEGETEDEHDSVQIYCAAYRYKSDTEKPVVETWHYPLQVGDTLPDLPLFITPEIAVPVKLEDAYRRTCVELKIGS